MKTNTTKLLASATLAMAFTASAVTAQTAEPTAAAEMAIDETVVVGNTLYTDQVNALKTPTPIIDVPQSLSITTADEISVRGFNSIGDIVDYTPGVTNNQGEGHRDAVVFRGKATTADFFVDGIRDDMQYYRPFYNVEQVEILRGPNALLFGRGGAGGVLNRVTKKGVIGENFNGYSLATNTFGATEAQIDSNIAVGNNVAFRLNAYVDTFKNHRDYSDGDGIGLNPTVKFQLSEDTTLDLSYEYIDYDRFVDRGIPTGSNLKPIGALGDTLFGDSDLNESKFEAHVFRALLQHKFSDTLKGNLAASYGDYDKLYQNFYAKNYVEANGAVAEKITLDGYADGTQRKTTTVNGSLVGEYETGTIVHTLLAGAEYINTANDNGRFKAAEAPGKDLTLDGLANFNGSFNVFADSTEANVEVMSLYIQDEISLSENLDLVLGLRYDSFDIDVSGKKFDKDKNKVVDLSGSQKDENFTPRAGIIYKPQENISVYASYSETFAPQSGDQFADLGKNRGLDPDEFTNLEAGVKWDFAQGYSLTAAIFQIDQKYASDDGDGGTKFVDAEIEGFEAQFLGQITHQWSVNAGYSYLTGEDKKGKRPAELPRNTLSFWNNYELNDKLVLGLGAIYQDENTPKSGPGVLPSFVRVDASASYQINEDLRIQLNVENLLDKDYYPNAYGTHQVTVGAPINARIALVGRF